MIITRADLISRIQQVPRGESTRAHAHADASSGETSARSAAACHRERPRMGFQLSPTRDFSRTNCQTIFLAHASRAGCISDMPDDHAPSIVGTLLVRAPGTTPAPAREEAMVQAIGERDLFFGRGPRARPGLISRGCASPDLPGSTGSPTLRSQAAHASAPENAVCSPRANATILLPIVLRTRPNQTVRT